MKRGFTLIELIIVIIIVGILAAVGISQYSTTVEKSRIAEAKIRIGVMRQLAYEYYLNNGSLTGITNSDLGVDDTCTSAGFYRYNIWGVPSDSITLRAIRCQSGGKTPDCSYFYGIYMTYYPGTDQGVWHCYLAGYTGPCFGMAPYP